MKKHNRKKSIDSILLPIITNKSVPSANALSARIDGLAEIQAIKRVYRNASTSQIEGRIFEAHHSATFNSNARLSTSSIRAITADRLPGSNTPGDTLLLKGNSILDTAELKVYKTPKRTAAQLSQNKYSGMQRIATSDQADEVKNILQEQTRTNLKRSRLAKAELRRETASRVSDTVEFKGVKSDPISKRDLQKLKEKPSRLITSGLGRDLIRTGRSGAASAAKLSAIFSGIQNIRQVQTGQKNITIAAKDVLVDAGGAAAKGGASAMGGVIIRTAAAKVGFKPLTGAAAPVAIATCALEISLDALRLANGKISATEFKTKSSQTIKSAAGGFGGMKAGASIGTAICPGLGTAVGGFLGAIFGSIAASNC